jgi:hypothetical protein
MNMSIVLRYPWALRAALLLALLLFVLLLGSMALHAAHVAHAASAHLLADSSTPDVIIHNH